MSFASLVNSMPADGRKISVRGGESQGRIVSTGKITVDKYKPTERKGSEYAAKYQAEQEMMWQKEEAELASRFEMGATGVESDIYKLEELTSLGTVVNVTDLEREELTQVYNNYSFRDNYEPPSQLQNIFSLRDEILKLIECNQVCVIKGDTGCGKSTQIPQFILKSCKDRNNHCNIVVTQPRRIAAISLAKHICNDHGWEIGRLVGYQVGLDKCDSEDTRLLYCTTGVLLEKIINKQSLSNFTHIILDEVHERESNMDLLMMIIKMYLRSSSTNGPKPKVILMSATMDVSRFAKYFEIKLGNGKEPAPTFTINEEKKKFMVHTWYSDSFAPLLGIVIEVDEEDPGISKGAYEGVPKMFKYMNVIDDGDYKNKKSLDKRGAVIIFLPGLSQIETLHNILIEAEKANPNDLSLWLCPLHSSITRDEQEKVHKYAPPGMRKVILSTNIAESSLTIPDVKFVIDFCLTKQLVADPNTGFSSLQLAWASHTNCIQRAGRVGRVQDGRVYRMVPRKFYELRMRSESLPEMQRCPLDIAVLKCKKLVENIEPLFLLSNVMDPPNLENYEKTILKLKEVGALLTTCNGELNPKDGDLTFLGQVMATLPVDIQVSKLILLGHIFGCLEEAIVMGCSMSVQNLFSERFQRKLEAYNNKLLWADSSESDVIAYLNVYNIWRQSVATGKFKTSVGDEHSWARRFMLQIKHLHEVAKLETDIKKRLQNLGIENPRPRNSGHLWNPQERPLILKLVLAGAFYPNYYIRHSSNPSAEAEAVKDLAGYSPFHSVYLSNMPQPAQIYEDQIRHCLQRHEIADEIKLHPDVGSSKMIVEFVPDKAEHDLLLMGRHFHSRVPGDIVMPVYRAIKMRQLNIHITIQTLPEQQVKEKLNRLTLGSQSSMRSLSSCFEHKPLVAPNEHSIEIEVVHVESAGRFFGHKQPFDRASFSQIQDLINEDYTLQDLTGEPVKDSLIYAAKFKDECGGECYYRAKVKKILKGKLEVFYIDFGNSSEIPVSDLKEMANEEIQEKVDKVPPFALECVLAEVAPGVWAEEEGKWSDTANKFVASTLMKIGKTWIAQVFSFINNVASVILYLDDDPVISSDDASKTLNNYLIELGYARKREESYFSKLNNEKRRLLLEKGEDTNAESLKESSVNMSFGKELFSLPTSSQRSSTVHLKGPSSPLEVTLYSLTHASSQKTVKVDWDSVNSVLLESDPADLHQKLLVAGKVSQSPDGRKLNLNQTTVLPNMHGLAALVCLIFAPTIELRTDRNFSRYTGALCGLGKDDKGRSLFPENDMEIRFDVEFIEQDIATINQLRYWMNQRYCCDYSDVLSMPNAEIFKIQSNIKKLTIELLKTVRDTVRVCPNPCQFEWGQVPSSLILKPTDLGDGYDAKYIYKFHSAIKVNPLNDRDEINGLIKKLETLEATLAASMAPRYLRCELCELDFDYLTSLKTHMASCSHHKELVTWLVSRAKELKLKMKRFKC